MNAGSRHRCSSVDAAARQPAAPCVVRRGKIRWSVVRCSLAVGSLDRRQEHCSPGALARKWGSAPSARRAAARPRTGQLAFIFPKVFTIRSSPSPCLPAPKDGGLLVREQPNGCRLEIVRLAVLQGFDAWQAVSNITDSGDAICPLAKHISLVTPRAT